MPGLAPRLSGKPLDRLLDPEPPIYSNPDQMALQWNRS